MRMRCHWYHPLTDINFTQAIFVDNMKFPGIVHILKLFLKNKDCQNCLIHANHFTINSDVHQDWLAEEKHVCQSKFALSTTASRRFRKTLSTYRFHRKNGTFETLVFAISASVSRKLIRFIWSNKLDFIEFHKFVFGASVKWKAMVSKKQIVDEVSGDFNLARRILSIQYRFHLILLISESSCFECIFHSPINGVPLSEHRHTHVYWSLLGST